MEDGIAEKDVMFVHFIVAFIGSLTLAFYKGWELSLVCLSSLPATFIALGLVAIVSTYINTFEACFQFTWSILKPRPRRNCRERN